MDSLSYFDQAFESFESKTLTHTNWLDKVRASAKSEFLKNGLPNLRDERWKYTSLRSLTKAQFALAASSEKSLPQFAKSFFLDDAYNLVFLDGTLISEQTLPPGVHISPLKKAFLESPDTVQETLKLCASVSQTPITLLNEAFLEEGSFIHLSADQLIPKTLHLINVITRPTKPSLSLPRHILFLEKHAQASVIETIVHEDCEEKVFTNTMTDIVLRESAQLSYAKFQRKGSSHIYLGHTRFFQEAKSKSFSFFKIGESELSREDISVKLFKEEAEARVRGVFHTLGKEHVDYHVSIDHAASFTKSRQLFKGVAEDQSRGVFNAHITVREGLRKIDAHQVTKNLLLGPDAEIDAKPHLEIDSDDVKCAHGAAVGRMNSDEVFYLQARGINRTAAEKILSTAFTEEVFLDIKDESFLKIILQHEANLNSKGRIPISSSGGVQ